jgi:PAS domain S-box-containing protein
MENLGKQYTDQIFEAVVEHAPTSIVLIDGEGRIVYVNRHTEELFGYSRSQLRGQAIETLIPGAPYSLYPEQGGQPMSMPYDTRMVPGRDINARHSDGTDIEVQVGLSPVETNKGKMTLVSIIDITHRKAQEAIIRKQLIDLEVKNKEIEQFSYIASHDLQEPLRTISNLIEMMKEDIKDLGPNAREFLTAIDHSAARMKALVRGLLDFSRLGTARDLASADCRLLIEEVTADLSVLISSSGAVVRIGEMPVIPVYVSEMRQLFQNLILNAIKFRREGVPPVISIGCRRVSDHWLFSVSDTGIGIQQRYQERIFHIFQRLHGADQYEGHGIGLAYCKKIVELHGGKIWVESTPGSGSTFYFTIQNLS